MGIHKIKGKVQSIGTVTTKNGTKSWSVYTVSDKLLYAAFTSSVGGFEHQMLTAYKNDWNVEVRYADDDEMLLCAVCSDGNKRKFCKVYATIITKDDE